MTDLTPEQLAELKAKAEAALRYREDGFWDAWKLYPPADFQDAASPDVVLALIAEVERLREQLEAAQERVSYLEQGNAILLQQAADTIGRIEAAEARAEQMRAALLSLVRDNEKRGVRSAFYYRARRELGLKPGESAFASTPKKGIPFTGSDCSACGGYHLLGEPCPAFTPKEPPAEITVNTSIYPDTWSKGPGQGYNA